MHCYKNNLGVKSLFPGKEEKFQIHLRKFHNCFMLQTILKYKYIEKIFRTLNWKKIIKTCSKEYFSLHCIISSRIIRFIVGWYSFQDRSITFALLSQRGVDLKLQTGVSLHADSLVLWQISLNNAFIFYF